jgi:hypothetical protein
LHVESHSFRKKRGKDGHPAPGDKPGSMFNEMLTAVEDLQLDGKISTKEEAMELVKLLCARV